MGESCSGRLDGWTDGWLPWVLVLEEGAACAALFGPSVARAAATGGRTADPSVSGPPACARRTTEEPMRRTQRSSKPMPRPSHKGAAESSSINETRGRHMLLAV